MAQQPLLALQVKPIDMPTYRGIMEERDTYRKQQNAMAQEQLKQQQNAMRQTIYRQNVDASGNINQQGIIRGLAQAGLGAEIPEQMKAYGQGVEAVAKGSNEQFKHAQEILTVSRNELGNARTPQEAMAAGMRIAQQYPEAADGIRQSLAQVQSMSPEQFGAWKMDALRKNLTAAQQLQQHFQSQNLGGSTRVLSMPEYGAGGAAVVPGSEAQVTMTPQQQYAAQNPAGKVVQDNNGNYVVVNTHIPGPVMTGGGGIPTGRGGGDFGMFKSAVVQTESHGDYTALSPKGALGAYQVMPATAKTLAGRLGLPWNPELMRSNTPEGRQYQDAIGNAAAQEAWQAGGGDPARAAAYYHGGSDTSKWKEKTQAYARNVVANIGNGSAAPAAGGGQLQGPTKGKPAATAKDQQAAADKEQQHKALTNELQMALDLVQDPANSSAFQSSKNSWWDNQSQSVLHGKFDPKTAEFGVHTALPGGVAHKSVWDRVTKHLIGAMYQTIKPGQAGMNRAVASQKMHIQMMGGGDNPSRETLIEAIKSTAADYGIKLNERSENKPQARAAAPANPKVNIGTPPQGVSAAEWQHMTPEERKLWAK
jgi:hypothetical protein